MSAISVSMLMDAGEFVAEIRPVVDDEVDDAGEVDHYILYDSPLSGTNLNLVEDDEGNPTVVIGGGVVEYTFDPVEE